MCVLLLLFSCNNVGPVLSTIIENQITVRHRNVPIFDLYCCSTSVMRRDRNSHQLTDRQYLPDKTLCVTKTLDTVQYWQRRWNKSWFPVKTAVRPAMNKAAADFYHLLFSFYCVSLHSPVFACRFSGWYLQKASWRKCSFVFDFFPLKNITTGNFRLQINVCLKSLQNYKRKI